MLAEHAMFAKMDQLGGMIFKLIKNPGKGP
jgi:hypothetical protein